jgi:deoxyribose-phosphate aldolase
MNAKITKEQFAKMIDHCVLAVDTTKEQVDKCLQETIEYGFGSCYVPWSEIVYAKSIIKGKARVGIGCGFPLGYSTTKAKIFEGLEGIENGVDKVDVVINVSKLKMGDYDYVQDELTAFVKAMKKAKPDVIISTIIEVSQLNHAEKIKASEIVRDSNSDYIKTSTGWTKKGCNIGDLKIFKAICPTVGIKISDVDGEIENALTYIEAGATVIGEDVSAVKWMSDWDKALF